jgi:hypothetical protein
VSAWVKNFAPSARRASVAALLAVAWTNSPARADTIETLPNRVSVQRLLETCRGTASVSGEAVEANWAGCIGYTRGVADALKDIGALDGCPTTSAVDDVVGKIGDRKKRYVDAGNGMASKLVSRMLVKSCSGKVKP